MNRVNIIVCIDYCVQVMNDLNVRYIYYSSFNLFILLNDSSFVRVSTLYAGKPLRGSIVGSHAFPKSWYRIQWLLVRNVSIQGKEIQSLFNLELIF